VKAPTLSSPGLPEMTARGPLRGVRRVEDAGAHWRLTLVCGHVVYRLKVRDRPTVFSSCHCVDCLEESAR